MRLISIAIALTLLSAACSRGTDAETATVLDVVDGDTVQVLLSGSAEDVRLIGLNTPERNECHADEATTALREMVSSGHLRLATAGPDDRDRFGRLLRYLYVDETLVNLAMVELGHGLATADTHPRREDFRAAGDEAWEARLGMWGEQACGTASATTVEIDAVQADPPGDDTARPNKEVVVLRNTGSTTTDLSGWRIRDESSSHRYVVAEGTLLAANARLTLHSGCGSNTSTDVYWCEGPVWSNGGDTVILQTATGTVVDRWRYGRD